jgi:serine/threonine protein kinase
MDKAVNLRYQPGEVIKGRYAVLGVCGIGGWGSIYRVRDLAKGNREVAVKVLNMTAIQEDRSAMERFRREALVASKLKHPNIVEVLDFNFESSEPPLIAMEFIDGISFAERIASISLPRLSYPEAEQILHKIAAGLAYAHTQRVVHRDLKPANILLGKDGSVKLSDFGLCRTDGFNKNLTTTGECVGTPLYMAPEQISGGQADPRSDIYSFGILAYEAVAGKVPFNGDTWFAIAEKHLRSKVPPLPIPTPEWFQVMLEICLSKNPEERFSDGRELLESIEEQILPDKRQSLTQRVSRMRRVIRENAPSRRRVANWISASVCAVLLLSLGFYSGLIPAVFKHWRGFDASIASAVGNSPPAVLKPEEIMSQFPPRRPKVSEEKSAMYVCRRNGTPIFTNSPPPGLECYIAK